MHKAVAIDWDFGLSPALHDGAGCYQLYLRLLEVFTVKLAPSLLSHIVTRTRTRHLTVSVPFFMEFFFIECFSLAFYSIKSRLLCVQSWTKKGNGLAKNNRYGRCVLGAVSAEEGFSKLPGGVLGTGITILSKRHGR